MSYRAKRVAFLLLLPVIAFTAQKTPENKCGPGAHWVNAHLRHGYIRGNGIVVKETNVRAHCQKNPPGYKKWFPKIHNGKPKYWGSKIDQPEEWTEEERERLLEALNEIPDFLKKDIDAIYRMKNLEHPENPSAIQGTTIVVYDAAFNSNQNLTQVLTHEMAHRYLENLPDKDKESFRQAAKWLGSSNFQPGRPGDQFLRPNGMLSYHEDFADDLAAYLHNPASLKAKSPEVFTWMKNHIGPKLGAGNLK